MSFYSCGKHTSISPAGNASAGWCAGGSPSSGTGSSAAWCRSHTAALSAGGACCSSPLPWPAPARQRVPPSPCSASRCQPPFPIREFSERAVPARWDVCLTREETQALSARKFELSLEQRRKMPSPLEQFMCLPIPAAHHGHISGSSFSSRPVLRCCCTGTCRLSSPPVPRPGPFLWLFQLLTPSLMHPFLHQLENYPLHKKSNQLTVGLPAGSISTSQKGSHG